MTTIHTVRFKNLVIHIRPYFWHKSNGRIGARLDIVQAKHSCEIRPDADGSYEWDQWDTDLTDAKKNKIDSFLKSEEGKKFLDLDSEVWKEPWMLCLRGLSMTAAHLRRNANELDDYVKLHPTVDKSKIE